MKKEFIQRGNLKGDEEFKTYPNCDHSISSEMKSAYDKEWCPYCGCNIKECKKLGGIKIISSSGEFIGRMG